MNHQIKTASTPELLAEIESKFASNSFTHEEIRIFGRILAKNHSQISSSLTQALQEERLKQQTLLSQLSPSERTQVNEFLTRHGLKKKYV